MFVNGTIKITYTLSKLFILIMKRNSLLIVLFLVLGGSFVANAQQDAQFSHYAFNSMYYNPGFAGIEGNTRFTGIFRRQWLGYASSSDVQGGNSPTSTVITGSSLLPFFERRTGAGFHFLYDTKGPVRTTEFQLSGAYHFKIGEGKLGVGLRAGVYNQAIVGDWYKVIDQNDPIYQALVNGTASQMKMDLAAGLYYNHPKYYIGASAGHLPRSKFSYGFDSISSKLSNHMYFTGGYHFKLGTSLVITPNAFFQTDLKQYTFLVGGLATYNEKYWGGISLRQSIAAKDVDKGGQTYANDDIIILIGMSLMKNNALRVGYAFDFVTSGVQAKTRTSHEIMLSYVIPVPWEIPKPPVRTPRYRHEEYDEE